MRFLPALGPAALAAAALSLSSLACSSSGSPAPEEPRPDAPVEDPRIAQGAALYGSYCALCHGAKGEGYTADNANALANQDFLAMASDDFLRRGTTRGRPGTAMSAWGKLLGGPLDDAQIDAIVVFLRSFQTSTRVDLSKVKVGAGAPMRGQAAWNVECATCHGTEGLGGTYMSVANPEFLGSANDAYLRWVIGNGRKGTPMPGYTGNLTEQAIDDVVTLLRSWAKPPGSGPIDLPSKDLGNPVMNPTGPEPAFPTGGSRFLKTDAFKAEYDKLARMVILDARPPGDYSAEHIVGAVSVPFYKAAEYLPQLPKDAWIVAYCACPHAESGAAADVLLKNGYTKVKVLDEGLPLWRSLGYPMRPGPKP